MSQPAIDRVLEIMARLRDRDSGCPWDVEQDFASIAPYTIEEAYEVADAIERRDHAALRDELGDLLLQVVFHAQMAAEQGLFDFEAVAAGLADKLVRRHPHVFGELAGEANPDVGAIWESQKRAERAATNEGPESALADVTLGLPALLRAQKLQKRAARVGFDWDDAGPALDKVAEELDELRAARREGPDAVVAEVGDLLFAAVNAARHLGVQAEEALRAGNRKFERRFGFIERRLAARGRTPGECTLAELDALWDEAKREER